MSTHRLVNGRRLVLAAVVGVLAFFGWQLSLSAQTAPGTVDVVPITGTHGNGLAITPDGQDIYVTTGDYQLARLDRSSFQIEERIGTDVYSAGGSGHLAIDPDGQFAYIVSGSVSKVDLATGLEVDEIHEGVDFTQLATPLIDAEGRFLYVGQTQNIGHRVAKIDLATFDEDDTEFLTFDRAGPSFGTLDPSGDYAYFGFSSGIDAGDVARVDLDSFTIDGILGDVGRGQTKVVGIDDDRMWVTTSVDRKFIEIDLATFSISREVVFPSGSTLAAAEVAVDSAAGLAYVTSGDDPGILSQVDLDDFSVLGSMSLRDGLDAPIQVTMGPDREYVYFLTDTWPDDGHVVRLKTGAMFVDFDDVAADHLFGSEIEWLAQADITRGCNPPDNTRFCPEDQVTRGQMAAFLHRALPDLATGATTDFTDDDGSVFEGDIEWLAAAGVTRGCNPPANTEFCPDDQVTRGQMAAFLVRALDLSAGDESFDDTAGHVFENDVAALAEAGVTRGCNPPANTQFCPDDPVTRGAMAAFLFRALGG